MEPPTGATKMAAQWIQWTRSEPRCPIRVRRDGAWMEWELRGEAWAAPRARASRSGGLGTVMERSGGNQRQLAGT